MSLARVLYLADYISLVTVNLEDHTQGLRADPTLHYH
jgi:hypothetical protein